MKQTMLLIVFLILAATNSTLYAQSYNSSISEREKNDCMFMIHATFQIFSTRPASTTDAGLQSHFTQNYNLVKELRDYSIARDYNPEIIAFLNSNLKFYAKGYNLVTEVINLKNKDYSEEIQQGAVNASMNAGYNIGQATAINGGTVEQAMALSLLASPFAAAGGIELARNEIINRINARMKANGDELNSAIRQIALNNISQINLIRRKMNWPMYYGGAMIYTPFTTNNFNGTYPLDGSDLEQYWIVQYKTNPFVRAEIIKKCLNEFPSKEYADEQIQKCLDLIPVGSIFNKYRQQISALLVYDKSCFTKPGMKLYINDNGKPHEYQSQDGRGNIVPNPNSSRGDIIHFTYFDNGKSEATETFCFNKDEKLFHTRITTFDKDGYTLKVLHKNESGDFIKLSGDVVGWKNINNSKGFPISMKFINQDEDYCPDQYGIYEKRMKYNSQDQLIQTTYHDKSGSICVNNNQTAGIEYEYDTQGNQTAFDLDKNLNRISQCVLITKVLPDSEAARVGIKVGDVIVKYNNVIIESAEDFIELTETSKMWETLSSNGNANSNNSEKQSITINRKGETIKFDVKPGKIGVKIRNATLPPEMRKPI